jgi:hypothetical protein
VATAIVFGFVQAQTKAMTQPSSVQPRNRLRIKIATAWRWVLPSGHKERNEVDDQGEHEEKKSGEGVIHGQIPPDCAVGPLIVQGALA